MRTWISWTVAAILFALLMGSIMRAQEPVKFPVDKPYHTAAQAIISSASEAIQAIQKDANDAVQKVLQAQCREKKIKPKDCTTDVHFTEYWKAVPVKAPGTAQ